MCFVELQIAAKVDKPKLGSAVCFLPAASSQSTDVGGGNLDMMAQGIASGAQKCSEITL